jgi:hypothetical protein
MTMTMSLFLSRAVTRRLNPLALRSRARSVLPRQDSLLVKGFLW